MQSNRPSNWNGEPVPYDAPAVELAAQAEGGDWAAFVALGADASVEATRQLSALSASPDWRIRRAAIEQPGHRRLDAEGVGLILAALRDRSAYVTRTALEAVRRQAEGAARGRVRELLAADDASTRRAALSALRTIWTAADYDRVRDVFLGDRCDGVRKEAAFALRDHVTDTTWRELVDLWRADTLPRHRVWACELIAQFGDASDGDVLVELAADRDGHVRKAAVRALDAMNSRTRPE